jgi:hypothetical protein
MNDYRKLKYLWMPFGLSVPAKAMIKLKEKGTNNV